MTTPRRGRPRGLTINPDAVANELRRAARSQAWLAREARISPSHLAELLSGAKGATADVAGRIAAALDVGPAVLFPELVTFRMGDRGFLSRPPVPSVA